MSQSVKHLLIAAFTFIGGLYYFLLFALPEKIGDFEFGIWNDQIGTGISVIGVMTIGLGLLNIVRVHGTRVVKTQRGWIFSFSLLAGFLIMLVSEGMDFINAEWGVNTVKRFSALALYSERIATQAAAGTELNEPTRESLKKMLAQLGNALDAEQLLEAEGRGLLQARGGRSAETQAELQAASEKFRALLVEARTVLDRLIAAYGSAYAPGVDPTLPEQQQLTLKLKELTAQVRVYSGLVVQESTVKTFARVLFNGFYLPLNSAMFALLGFYIAGAAYRSFRLKSVEAAVLMLTAVVVILGQIPFGKMYIHDSLPNVRVWLMENLNTPGNRAMFLGSSVAAIALAMRMWLSLEKSPLDEGSS